MNDIISEIYGTEKIASAEDGLVDVALDQLEKVASENGLDLDSLSEDDIAEIIYETLSELGDEDGAEKTASYEDIEKVAEADYSGRVFAHAFLDELEKFASDESEDGDYDPFVDRANEILAAAEEAIGVEKTASDDDILNAGALEILDAEGYDVETIVELLS